jgi:hypothetical protein
VRVMELGVRLAGDTAAIETGLFLIIKRCLYGTAFCNYRCINIEVYLNC